VVINPLSGKSGASLVAVDAERKLDLEAGIDLERR